MEGRTPSSAQSRRRAATTKDTRLRREADEGVRLSYRGLRFEVRGSNLEGRRGLSKFDLALRTSNLNPRATKKGRTSSARPSIKWQLSRLTSTSFPPRQPRSSPFP